MENAILHMNTNTMCVHWKDVGDINMLTTDVYLINASVFNSQIPHRKQDDS